MKLRLGLPFDDLAYRTDTCPSYMSKIFHRWIDMSIELKHLVAWPGEFALRENMSNSFRKHFSMSSVS